jgi:membrane-associated phospholipid phosphatase
VTSSGPIRRDRFRRRAIAALVAAASAVAFVSCYLVMVRTAAGQVADVAAFRVVFGLVPSGWPAELITLFARAAVVVALGAVAVVLGVAAVGRGAWGAVLGALVTVGVSLALGIWLRDDVLVRPRFTEEAFPANSLPSTHAVAAAALIAAVLLLWPGRRPWWLVNAAGVVLLLVAVGNVESQAHRPSDVAASFLLVGAVFAAVLVVVGPPRSRR